MCQNQEPGAAMLEKTKADYRKLASFFYRDIEALTLDAITDKLALKSAAVTPGYFARLKSAIAFDQLEKGYSKPAKIIREMRNPATDDGEDRLGRIYKKPPVSNGSQKRVRIISDADFKLLHSKSSDELRDVLTILKTTGARPSELPGIKMLDNNQVYIPAVKANDDGTRGASRTIQLSKMDAWRLSKSIKNHRVYVNASSNKNPLEAVRMQLRAKALKLWPRRKPICFYTLRHKFGSELKATAGMSKKEKSYLMGHQATASISRYGNRQSGGRGSTASAADKLAADTVRDTDKADFTAKNSHHNGMN